MPDNYKRDNKNDVEEMEEEIKESEPGCCGGWLGMKFVLNKMGKVFMEDPAEFFTSGMRKVIKV